MLARGSESYKSQRTLRLVKIKVGFNKPSGSFGVEGIVKMAPAKSEVLLKSDGRSSQVLRILPIVHTKQPIPSNRKRKTFTTI